MSVIVLNADNTYIGSISWQASIVLLYKGKVEMVKATDRVVSNVTKSVEFVVPKVVRLIRFVKQVYKKSNVAYSKRAVFIRDKYKCQFCGIQLEKKDCTVDHVVPKARGGQSTWTNCVTSCTDCNNLKGDLTLDQCKKHPRTRHLKLRRQPQTPSVRDFLSMKAINIVLDDI
jgi:5-methylcytosine-specific restriction endonuclease McrA